MEIITDISVKFQISHTYLPNLGVKLAGPSSVEATLADREYGSQVLANKKATVTGVGATIEDTLYTSAIVKGTWGVSWTAGDITATGAATATTAPPSEVIELGPKDDLDVFLDDVGTGDWKLTIVDVAGGDVGNLDYWRVKLTCA